MKRNKRWLAIALVFVLCLPLCGCQELEDMRAAHAVWQEDGTILWNGDVYLELEKVPEGLGFYSYDAVWVTEKDVPVLLSESFGHRFSIDAQGVLLHSWNWDGEETYFCREDKYDYIAEYLRQDTEQSVYFYTYWGGYKDGEEKVYYLSDGQGKTIDELLLMLEFTVLSENFYSSFEVDDFSVTLGRCDEEHLFRNDYVLEIVRKDGRFYLMMPDGRVGEVPAKYDDRMKVIVSVFYNEEIQPYI